MRRPLGALALVELLLPWIVIAIVLLVTALGPRRVIYLLPPLHDWSRCDYLREWAIAHGQRVLSCAG